MSIERNVRIRKAVKSGVALMAEWLSEHLLPDEIEDAWRATSELAEELTGTKEAPEEELHLVMTDQEAKRFEFEPMPFGQYKNFAVGNVPIDYLVFLAENDFQTSLKRYIKRREIWDQQSVSEP